MYMKHFLKFLTIPRYDQMIIRCLGNKTPRFSSVHHHRQRDGGRQTFPQDGFGGQDGRGEVPCPSANTRGQRVSSAYQETLHTQIIQLGPSPPGCRTGKFLPDLMGGIC